MFSCGFKEKKRLSQKPKYDANIRQDYSKAGSYTEASQKRGVVLLRRVRGGEQQIKTGTLMHKKKKVSNYTQNCPERQHTRDGPTSTTETRKKPPRRKKTSLCSETSQVGYGRLPRLRSLHVPRKESQSLAPTETHAVVQSGAISTWPGSSSTS